MPRLQLLHLLPALALGAILMLATWQDVRTRRIPNALIVAGLIVALSLHALLPTGSGFFAAPPGGRGLLFGLAGCTLGLLLLLPLYALRTLGAGDVKLIAVVGAFVGSYQVMGAILLTMLAGGLLAVVVALGSGQLTQVVLNLQHMLSRSANEKAGSVKDRFTVSHSSTGKLPYAIAIACGTAAQLMLAGTAGWRFFS